MRTDTYGVSSIVRVLYLNPVAYHALLHFFHSSAWNINTTLQYWWKWIIHQQFEHTVNQRIVLTGDHTKNAKDGRKIPKVETLHQDSETASKPSYFRGHHWACIGLVINRNDKFFSTPLWTEIHQNDWEEKRSTRIVSKALEITKTIKKKGYLLLDAFFSVGPVFQLARNTEGENIHIVTRAKKNSTAYLPAAINKKGKRGPKPKYGKKLKLMELFDSKINFAVCNADVYGASEKISYLVLDLMWKPIKGLLRFILIESSHGRIILMTTDFSLTAQTALHLYCKRASIETLFNSLKNLLGGLGYHFWSKYLKPASRRPAKKGTPVPISSNPHKTTITLNAIEKFVTVQIIALGILQLIAFRFSTEVIKKANCFMRTPPRDIPSEFMTKIALINIFNNNFAGFAKNMITALITEKRNNPLKSTFFEKVA